MKKGCNIFLGFPFANRSYWPHTKQPQQQTYSCLCPFPTKFIFPSPGAVSPVVP